MSIRGKLAFDGIFHDLLCNGEGNLLAVVTLPHYDGLAIMIQLPKTFVVEGCQPKIRWNFSMDVLGF